MSGGLPSLAAMLLVATGLSMFAFGRLWAPAARGWLPDGDAGPWLELFVPFLPMVLIVAGAVIYCPRRRP